MEKLREEEFKRTQESFVIQKYIIIGGCPVF